ncbi:MAG: phosphoribosylamine--glycine ligase [Opitutales bacterium]
MKPDAPFRILVVGSGGREHALVQACDASSRTAALFAAPGNPGIAEQATCLPVPATDIEGLLATVREHEINLVVVGPEVPLSLGLADRLRAVGVQVYGPGRAAAQLESSKAFSKAFMKRHDIPTAAFDTVTSMAEAEAVLERSTYPIVIKASGLAAGKGVIITDDPATARKTVGDMLSGEAFGDSGREVVIEAFMEGPEASVHLLVSGGGWAALPVSQDHKRIGEGDSGPNTGGMGAYAPAPVMDEATWRTTVTDIIGPTLGGLAADGLDYRGTLYIGLMLTRDGPRVLEYNVRFGDPEAQVLLPLLDGDWVPLLATVARGEAPPDRLPLKDQHALIVVMAAEGYPGSYARGRPIRLPEEPPDHLIITQAGTRRNAEGKLVSAGGRVLGVTGLGKTLRTAADRAYAGCGMIDFPGHVLRRDIGYRAL